MGKEKDNGYVENNATGEVAEAAVDATGEKESGQQSAPTELGKFKDVDALQRAYDCLQAEFTRRSQRLKVLEKQVENFRSEEKRETLTEKLRNHARKSRAEKDAFDGFVSEIEKVNVGTLTQSDGEEQKPLAKETSESAEVETALRAIKISGARMQTENTETEAQNAEKSVPQAEGLALRGENGEGDVAPQDEKTSVVARESVGLSTEELYERASRDEQVRLKIIGEYLASVGKSSAPLSRGGTGTLAAPIRAKSVQEAGLMALRFLKGSGAEA